jgi:hypothetical protein
LSHSNRSAFLIKIVIRLHFKKFKIRLCYMNYYIRAQNDSLFYDLWSAHEIHLRFLESVFNLKTKQININLPLLDELSRLSAHVHCD